jgi:hypothetical protein
MVDLGSRHGRAARSQAGSAVSAWGAHAGAQTTLLAGMLGLGAVGCGEPMADVVAVWVDGVADDEGNRGVRIYQAGERDVVSIVPDIPGSGIDLLQIGVDGRGRGVAVSATDATVWLERDSGRRVTLSAAAAGRNELVAAGFSFTHSNDALLRVLEVDPALPPAWLLSPLLPGAGERPFVLGPPAPAPEGQRWALAQAADAPVIVMAQVSGTAVSGEVLAVAYPSDQGEGPVVDELRPLARGIMAGRGTAPADDLGYLSGCSDGLCVSPSGRVLWVLTYGSQCELQRWSWLDATSTEEPTPPLHVPLPCPSGGQAQLVAALDDDLLVLDDPLRLYLVAVTLEPQDDGGAGGGAVEVEATVRSLPKPSGLLVPHLVGHGRVLLVASQQGEVARIDADGVRMVSGVQSTCVLRDGFAVSPGGAWVVQSCNGQNGGPDGLDGQIQRISVLGSEIYAGLPMRPIAVDDEGNALLYSIASDDDDGEPRGLFVLTGDGQLTRVDELEPFPGQVLVATPDGVGRPGRFAAGGPG